MDSVQYEYEYEYEYELPYEAGIPKYGLQHVP